MRRPVLRLLLPAFALASVAAGRVDPSDVEASSVYPPEDGVRYDAKMAFDGRLSTSWVEGEEGSGLGSWLKVQVPNQQEHTRLPIWGWLWTSYNYCTRTNECEFSNIISADNGCVGANTGSKTHVRFGVLSTTICGTSGIHHIRENHRRT